MNEPGGIPSIRNAPLSSVVAVYSRSPESKTTFAPATVAWIVAKSVLFLAGERVFWLVQAHHIVLDGFGYALLYRQVSRRYGGEAAQPFGRLADLVADQQTTATMSMLLPPQMLNTMVPDAPMSTEAFYADPVRRYMLPVASDRRTDWPSHPYATRDSLHEHDMWVAEGLTHRYPTKVLAELLSTCPQYCGHCTRMDLVGNSTPQVDKLKLTLKPVQRYDAHIDYLRAHPGVRDVVVSVAAFGGAFLWGISPAVNLLAAGVVDVKAFRVETPEEVAELIAFLAHAVGL